jgi:hypothetical protein
MQIRGLARGQTPGQEPQWTRSWMPLAPTTPIFPQNLMRANFMNGVKGSMRVLTLGGLGSLGESDGTMEMFHDGTATAEEAAYLRGQMMVMATFASVGLALGAYHGYKRNKSAGWALAWGLAGAVMPVPTVSFAFGQGFARKPCRV